MPVKPIIGTPETGGRLITRRSNVAGGISNYVLKRDFRRDMDKEIRQEGDDYFHPNLDAELGKQPFPLDQDYSISGFTNGGFEIDNDLSGVPDDWLVTATGGVFSLDNTEFTEGSRSIKFTTSVGTESGYIENEALLPVGDNRRWSLRFSAKASSPGRTLQAEIRWFDSDGLFLSSSVIIDEDAQLVWTGYSRLTTPPSTAAFGKLRITGKVTANNHIGSLWVDDVKMVERDTQILQMNLLGEFRRPNGRVAVIAATTTTIYRFNFDGNSKYVSGGTLDPYVKDGYVAPDYVTQSSDGNYVADGYFQAAQGSWTIIGSGFSKDGNRWEAIPVGHGYAIFNNGVDLPVSYQVNESAVKPIYEMREAGIVKVGTIAEFSGTLHCGDVSVLHGDQYESLFSHISPPSITKIKQYGSVSSLPHRATAFLGGAVDLGASGSGKNVSFADDIDLHPSVDWTIEAMVKLGSTPEEGKFYTIFGKSDSYRFGVEVVGGKYYLRLEIWASSFRQVMSSATAIDPGRWIHVAVVVDNNADEERFYRNGEFLDKELFDLSVPDSNVNSAFCGAGTFTGATNQTGGMQIAELRFWKTNRTSDQIRDNYTTDVTGQSNLSAYWKFDDAGGTATDSTGNGNTGTLNAGAAFVASDAPTDSYVEMEKIAQNTLTRNGNVASFMSLTAHGFTTGQMAIISGAADASYNTGASVSVIAIDPFRFTYVSVGANGSTTGASVQRSLFETGHVTKRLSFFNGLSTHVTKYISTVRVKVDKSVASLVGHKYSFYIIAESDSILTGTVTKAAAANTLVGIGTAFTTELSVGQSVRVGTTEEVRRIATIADDTNATVESNWANNEGGISGYRVTDFTLLSNFDYFTLDMVGRKIFFPDGRWRLITEFVNAKRVETSNHRSVSLQTFLLENIAAYDAITDGNKFDRFRYRRAWSDIERPRIWEASPPGTIEAGNVLLRLAYQARSFERGDRITITGAGINGGNLTAIIRVVHPDHQTITLDTAADTSVEDADVQRTDSIGSTSGYQDETDASSAIIKMLAIETVLQVYHDLHISSVLYTGRAESPFAYRVRYYGSKTPYYRFTLVCIATAGVKYHLYAGRNSFYVWDLTRQTPMELPQFEDVENIFFKSDIDNINLVYAVDNPITKQVFFQFPSSTSDKGLCYDYLFKTFGTTQASYTAMACIRRVTGNDDEPTHDWFICASPQGAVLLFGKTDRPEPQWDNRSEIFHRHGSDYESRLKSALWGGRMNEVTLTEYVLELDSEEFPTLTPITINVYGYDATAKAAALLFTKILSTPIPQNMIGTHFEKHFFQDEIVASGNGPCRITARIVNVGGIESHSHARRQLVNGA